MIRFNRVSVAVVAGILALGFAAASLPDEAAAQNVRNRLLQQQQQMQKKKIVEQPKLLPDAGKLPQTERPASLTEATAKNNDKYKEADVIYLNLRKGQHLSHAAAIAMLKNSGFPTDKIVQIP
ncbi:MAG: hypothetical protein HQ503_02440 [Rhodospirillales bacterium]|nr:hypothetical protein [Rhodospirillales bacterium]